MALKNTRTSWGWPARALHWAVAVLILGQIGVGLYMVEVVGDDLIQRFELTQLHKSFGFVVFALAALRVIWRAMNPTPALPEMPGWQKAASRASHLALYVLMFAIPVTGWLMASASPLNDEGAYPFQVKNMVFGLFELPDPYAPGDKALSEWLAAVHFWASMTLAAVLAVHVAASLKHQFVDRDGLLRRMVRGA